MATVVAAWVIGAPRQRTDVGPFLHQALPPASEFAPIADGTYEGRTRSTATRSVAGYVSIVRVHGYGGPMRVAVGIDTSGSIAGAAVIDHNETPAFFDRIKAASYLKALAGKSHADRFRPGDDIDAVSGATISLEALATSVRRGGRRLAADALGLPAKAPDPHPVRFGIPEALLILLFVLGSLTYSRPPRRMLRFRNALRWLTRLAGLLLLGFAFTIPLSIANVHALLAGYYPDWRTSIYWYLLIVIAFGPLVLTNRKVYCDNICPFGATQDLLKLVGGAKRRLTRRYRYPLRWMQRSLAWAAIVVALLFRNPGRIDYEAFGTFFTLTGTVLQWAFLGVVLVVSLFLFRPWCDYLCPLRAVGDYITMLRRWARESLTN